MGEATAERRKKVIDIDDQNLGGLKLRGGKSSAPQFTVG